MSILEEKIYFHFPLKDSERMTDTDIKRMKNNQRRCNDKKNIEKGSTSSCFALGKDARF